MIWFTGSNALDDHTCDAAMVAQWNSIVQPKDTVFCIGGFLAEHSRMSLASVVSQLSGKIVHAIRVLDCVDLSLEHPVAMEVSKATGGRISPYTNGATVNVTCEGRVCPLELFLGIAKISPWKNAPELYLVNHPVTKINQKRKGADYYCVAAPHNNGLPVSLAEVRLFLTRESNL